MEPKIVLNKTLEDFVSNYNRRFFTILGILFRFLIKDVCNWKENEDYKIGEKIIQSMRVVNNVGERTMALMGE